MPANLAGKSQHIGHRVKTWLLVFAPQRGLYGAARENVTIFRYMGEFEPLAWSCENYFVISDHSPAAQRCKADIAESSQAGEAVACAYRVFFKRNTAALSRSSAEEKGSARRSVNLHPVMHFDDLDVIFRPKSAGGLFDESCKEIDAKAHIARAYDDRMTCSGFDPRKMLLAQAGRTYDVHNARLSREGCKFDGRFRRSEIKDTVGAGNHSEGISTDRDAHLAATGEQARILANRNGVRLLDCTHKMGARGMAYDFNEDAAHTSGRSGNDKPHIAHGWPPAIFPSLVYRPWKPRGKGGKGRAGRERAVTLLLLYDSSYPALG